MSTRRTIKHGVYAAVVTGVAAFQSATAQEAEDLTVEVGECVEIASPEERLACFEAQVEAARRERSGSEDRRRAAEPAEPSRTASEDRRRRDEPRAAAPEPRTEEVRAAERNRAAEERRSRREQRGPRGGDPDAAEVVANVAELRETVPNRYLITLDNGQVWRQTRPMAYPLRLGAEVRLYSTNWGDSYRLTMPEHGGGYIQVERVR